MDKTRRYHEPGNAICDVPELLISVRRPNAPPYRPFPSPTPRLRGTVGELPGIEGPSHSQVWEATPPKPALSPQSKEWKMLPSDSGRPPLRPQRTTRTPRSNHHPAQSPPDTQISRDLPLSPELSNRSETQTPPKPPHPQAPETPTSTNQSLFASSPRARILTPTHKKRACHFAPGRH